MTSNTTSSYFVSAELQ